MIEYLGPIASVLFISGAVSQAFKCYKDGHARDISHGLIWPLLVGFVFMGIHVLRTVGWDTPLMMSFILQAASISIIAKYKLKERSKRTQKFLR